MIDDILYRQREEGTEKDLVVPESMRFDAMAANHDLPSSGHQGIDRTKKRMKERVYWYGMGKDIANFVSSCPTCNRNKEVGQKRSQSHAGVPGGCTYGARSFRLYGAIAKDYTGKRACTHDVLMMVDQFTKWVECVPLLSQTAEVTASAAVNNFFSRFGYPYQVFTDQGRNFESKLFTALCDALEIHKARTTPYRPSANGQVERFNRT